MATRGFPPRAGSNPVSVKPYALERCVLAMATHTALGPAAQAAPRWRAQKTRAADFGERSNEPVMQCVAVAVLHVTVMFAHA